MASAAASSPLIEELASYVLKPPESTELARATARLCLLDSLGCALAALAHDECSAQLGPPAPGVQSTGGAKVIGTGELLDPLKAAFDNGALIRWLDFNDTWLAAEWGHPSDNLGGLLAIGDYLCRNGHRAVTVGELLELSIQAHEIQGVLALENSFNRVGLDHVLLVRIASTATICKLLGVGSDRLADALANAFIDGSALRTYRHAPNVTARKSWAAGDATSRAARLALMAKGPGVGALPAALETPTWGFGDVLLGGAALKLAQPLGCYVMENILFKVAYPAEFHAQTALEAAIALHPEVKGRLAQIERIEVRTQEAATRIIVKDGPLRNYADRDHCLQYIVAVGLCEGDLVGAHYHEPYATRPELERLRALTAVREEPRFSADYLDPAKRSIANAVKVLFADGSATAEAVVEYPLGHRRRRDEAKPALLAKFASNATAALGEERTEALLALFEDPAALDATSVSALVDQLQARR